MRCVYVRMCLRSPASIAVCCLACSSSKTCCSNEECAEWELGGGVSTSCPTPAQKHCYLHSYVYILYLIKSCENKAWVMGSSPAGREDVERNFPVRAPPPRSDWMAWRSASCWEESFWVPCEERANSHEETAAWFKAKKTFCSGYVNSFQLDWDSETFNSAKKETLQWLTVMCVFAGRPSEIFGKEGEV